MTRKWRQKSDPLFRGDHADAVGLPSPSADDSIVRHVLYLDGVGRKTPYLSTTELCEIAEHFGGRNGRVWKAAMTQGSANRRECGLEGTVDFRGATKRVVSC